MRRETCCSGGALRVNQDRPVPDARLAVEMLESLRAPGATGLAPSAGVESVERLIGYVRGLLQENEGLADEVLRGYEQLNLIFDFTRQIATITDPDEIVGVLLNRISKIFAAECVYLVEQTGRTRVSQG